MRTKQLSFRTCICLGVLALPATPAAVRVQQPDAAAGVEKRAVVIWSEATRMAGDLYFPAGRKKDERLPAVVCCNGWGGTRQNTTGRVAARFAREGYVALAFDYRGWGDSDSKLVLKEKMPRPDEKGEVVVRAQAVREVVDPFDEALDIRHAVDFLVGEPGVDPERVGLWGTSYGGGLVTWTAANDRRVRCVVAQVPGMGVLGPQALKKGEERATQQARGTIAPVPQDYDAVPNLRGHAHLAKMVGYDAVAASARVKVPILFIDAEKEELFDRLQNGKKAHDIVAANQVPTKYHVVKGITHYGVYREGFEEAISLAVAWFGEHLKDGGKK
jgi:dienelactone hydrolase